MQLTGELAVWAVKGPSRIENITPPPQDDIVDHENAGLQRYVLHRQHFRYQLDSSSVYQTEKGLSGIIGKVVCHASVNMPVL